uniref:FBA_2 domain-containing protein n=1 Tax=Globodera pallida TaxID=36090 RepID=A0A183CL60_GLOPA
MEIDRAIGGNGAGIRNKRSREPQLPIPQEPIPTKVIGFERIIIGYIDQSVIEFLQRFRCLFNSSGTNVYIARNLCDQSRRREIIHQKIWPLVNDNICGFRLYFSDLDDLRQFSPTILRNCANLRSIDTVGFSPEFPADDNADASSEQALTKWLFTSRGDGLPKMLYCWLSSAEKLKRSFVNALESANFIIRLRSFSGIEPFELTNNLTGERLTLRRINEDKWLLVRCPIGQEDKWAEWEDEANGWECYYQWNLIIVCFNNSDTGDGLASSVPVSRIFEGLEHH